MYAAVERVLAARPDWISSASSSFDLLIAERWAIPHSRLGRDGFGGTPSRVPLTNHTRGSKAITVKGLMVKSLRALCETVPGAADFLPETYLVTPGEASDAAERAALLRTPRTEDECWICKPTGGAHGVGIEICRDARDALRAIDASHRSDGGRTETRDDDVDLSDGKSVVRAPDRAVFADDTKDAGTVEDGFQIFTAHMPAELELTTQFPPPGWGFIARSRELWRAQWNVVREVAAIALYFARGWIRA